MEFIGTVITGIFVAILLFTAFTFGFMLLVWFAIAGVAIALLFFLRETLRRWLFLRRGKMQERQSVEIIEVDYEDISDK